MFSKTPSRSRVLSYSMTYAQSPLIIIVPPGLEHSSFSKLLNPFDDSVWLVFTGMIIFFIVITAILKCQSIKVRNFVLGANNRNPLLNAIGVIVGLPISSPGRNFARWNLMMFVILLLILRSLYQSSLYKDLQSSKRNLPVQTIEETLKRNFRYYMIPPTQENIENLPEVYNRKIVVSRNDSVGILKRFNDPSFRAGFLAALDTVRYSNKANIYDIHFNICDEPLMQRQYGIVFPKASFLEPIFNRKLIIFIESGLIRHWLSQQTEVSNHNLEQPPEPKKLTLNHLKSAYQVLFLGKCLAIVVVIVELLSMKSKFIRNILEFFT